MVWKVCALKKFVEDSSISKFKVNPVSIAGNIIEKGQLRSKGIKEQSSWVVEFPHELSLTFEDGVRLHQISLGCCLQLAQELPGSMIEGDGFEVVRLMKVARLEVMMLPNKEPARAFRGKSPGAGAFLPPCNYLRLSS